MNCSGKRKLGTIPSAPGDEIPQHDAVLLGHTFPMPQLCRLILPNYIPL